MKKREWEEKWVTLSERERERRNGGGAYCHSYKDEVGYMEYRKRELDG
jgi:hypothetical protein